MIDGGGDGPNVDSLPPGIISLAEAILGDLALPLDSPSDRAALVDVAPTADDSPDPTMAADRTGSRLLGRLLDAPLRLEADWPPPAAPVEVDGGWIHPEVLADDRPLFEALLDRHGADGPEAIATACQEARLPVSPYRSPATVLRAPGVCGDRAGRFDQPAGLDAPDLSGRRVLDLTTHWAGPLATKLLAAAGASVIKVDPECRPDGFRDRPNLYDELNGQKDVIDCDLRTEAGRHRFEQLVADADLLVESFSRRVMPNFGYSPPELQNRNRRLNTISIKPFGHGTAEAQWLAYGAGVHAMSGLGFADPSRPGELREAPAPAPVAYPDFLTGIAAYAAGFGLLSATDDRQHTAEGHHVEISMLDVIHPLVFGLFGAGVGRHDPMSAVR